MLDKVKGAWVLYRNERYLLLGVYKVYVSIFKNVTSFKKKNKKIWVFRKIS